MAQIRVTHPIPPELNHDCGRLHVDSYELQEVMLPKTGVDPARKAIRVVIHGKNLKAVAQPLVAFVGKVPLRFLRIAPDERSVEGILLEEPQPGAPVEVILGDQDGARHPTVVDLAKIVRI